MTGSANLRAGVAIAMLAPAAAMLAVSWSNLQPFEGALRALTSDAAGKPTPAGGALMAGALLLGLAGLAQCLAIGLWARPPAARAFRAASLAAAIGFVTLLSPFLADAGHEVVACEIRRLKNCD